MTEAGRALSDSSDTRVTGKDRGVDHREERHPVMWCVGMHTTTWPSPSTLDPAAGGALPVHR